MEINKKHSVVPKGLLKYLKVEDIKPNPDNPRKLFDPDPLNDLKESIKIHGVLVPITVYELKGQDKFAILDGERRFRSCVLIEEERSKENENFEKVEIPANIVDPPDKIANLLYMFSIHNFREEWELMPTALSLKAVVDELELSREEVNKKKLAELTGLSETIVERCKWLLEFDQKYQIMSLDPNPKTRIPSNFWIEAYPVIDLYEKNLPELIKKLGKDELISRLVQKYRDKKIKSVIHFRKIREAYSNAKEDSEDKVQELYSKMTDYVTDVSLETRATFDDFLRPKQVKNAISACDDFVEKIAKLKIEFATENRDDVKSALTKVKSIVDNLLNELKGRDDPDTSSNGNREK